MYRLNIYESLASKGYVRGLFCFRHKDSIKFGDFLTLPAEEKFNNIPPFSMISASQISIYRISQGQNLCAIDADVAVSFSQAIVRCGTKFPSAG